jgi:selenide,water dikinase
LYSEQAELWPPALLPALRREGVDVRPGMPVEEIQRGPLVIVGASTQEFDLVILATTAAPLAWLRNAGLPVDERGFLLVDDMLRSVANPDVFAAGDCATLQSQPLPRSGVYSVRQGETLVASLRNMARGEAPVAYRAQPHALVLVSCGRRYALAQRGGWSTQGRWVWWWKNHLDRKWIASLTA